MPDFYQCLQPKCHERKFQTLESIAQKFEIIMKTFIISKILIFELIIKNVEKIIEYVLRKDRINEVVLKQYRMKFIPEFVREQCQENYLCRILQDLQSL